MTRKSVTMPTATSCPRRERLRNGLFRNVGLLLAMSCVSVAGIDVTPAQVAELRSIAEAVRRNQAELGNYDWKSRMRVEVNGELREVTLVQVRFDGKGRLVKTPLPDESAAEGKKKRKRKAVKLDAGLRNLIQAYTELTPGRMRTILARAKVRPDRADPGETTRVQVRSVINQGDSMDAWVDRATGRPRRFEIFTSLEGEPVHLVTEFGEIEGGPNFPTRTVVRTELKKKTIVITTENFDYVRQGG